jgi:uncharacterized protein (DUF1810 family)
MKRFIEAQERDWQTALSEIRAGHKYSHWIWYIFPQLSGLGKSNSSIAYAIYGLEEAKEYLAHPILSARIKEISEALLAIDNTNAIDILGPIDAKKVHSSMTLFSLISEDGSVFHKVLDKYYGGKLDKRTLELLNGQNN